MERSYEEIRHIIALCGGDFPGEVKKGARRFLPDRRTPVSSPAALDLAERAMGYSPERPLYVAAIAALTNIASALLLNPEIAERMVVCALAGNAHDVPATDEFNLMQDVAAAQVLSSTAAYPWFSCPARAWWTASRLRSLSSGRVWRDKGPCAPTSLTPPES